MVEILGTSFVLSLFKRVKKRYRYYMVEKIIDIDKHSQIHKFSGYLYTNMKTYFKNSFFGKISEIKQEPNVAVLNRSKFINRLSLNYKICKNKILAYFKNSEVADLTQTAKEDLYFFPLRIFSFAIITAIPVNTLLSLLLNKGINLFGWITRLFLLFIGIFSLKSSLDWPTIKNNSLILRFFLK